MHVQAGLGILGPVRVYVGRVESTVDYVWAKFGSILFVFIYLLE